MELGETRAEAGHLQKAEDLRLLTTAELMDVFRKGRAPETLEAIEGDPRGVGVGLHMLAGSWLDRWIRKRAATERFLWHGKSFRMKSPTEGWGFNRAGRGPLVAVFPFKTTIGQSVIDDERSVIIDYNVPRNPWWERLTWDELREVSPGIYLGVTTLRLFGRYRVALWFAVDTTAPQTWAAA